MSKITKKQVAEYRKWIKLSLIIGKGLQFIRNRIDCLEAKFMECVAKEGSHVVDGFLAEIKTRPGKTGIAYKDCYEEAYKMLSEVQKLKMDIFLTGVTKPAVPSDYVDVTDTNITLFKGMLKDQEAADIVIHVEALLDITPFK